MACSGGLDSTLLLEALCRFRPEVQVTVAHVNYCLRSESTGDADFVRRLADRHGLLFYERVADLSKMETGVEEKARQNRYRFFDDVLSETGSSAVLLGQHRDDQVETILLQLIRGGAWQNKSGMAAESGRYRRPFLTLSKKELLAAAKEMGLAWREDQTNQDPHYTKRNQLRQVIIPALQEMNARFPEHLLELGTQMAEQQALIQGQAVRYYADFVQDYRSVPDEWWPACLKEMATRAGYYRLKKEQIDQFCQLLHHRQRPNGRIDLGDGYFFEKTYYEIALKKKETTAPVSNKKMVKVSQQNGPLVLELDQWYFFTDSMLKLQSNAFLPVNDQCIALPKQLDGPLSICLASKGDRLSIPSGHKTVRRLQIDEKIPVEDRAKTLLLKDQQENILAVFLGQKRWYFTQDWPKGQPNGKHCLVWRIEEN